MPARPDGRTEYPRRTETARLALVRGCALSKGLKVREVLHRAAHLSVRGRFAPDLKFGAKLSPAALVPVEAWTPLIPSTHCGERRLASMELADLNSLFCRSQVTYRSLCLLINFNIRYCENSLTCLNYSDFQLF